MTERVDPAPAGDVAAFVAALRELKERSGFTLRQLEERATLPRPELLAAFVRACGERDRLADWMLAYERLVREGTATDPASAGDAPAADSAAARAPRTGFRTRLLAAATATRARCHCSG